MIEKLRVSLWDVFTFFFTGLVIGISSLSFMLLRGGWEWAGIVGLVGGLGNWFWISIPVFATLLGVVFEPFSNYIDRYVLDVVFRFLKVKGGRRSRDSELMKFEISKNHLGSLSGCLSNPYSLCKEYVETKQLSTTFMVFLSRYGFYRNCSVVCLVVGLLNLFLYFSCASFLFLLGSFLFSGVFKRRAEEFYSYMEPSVYSAFLIDKLWR